MRLRSGRWILTLTVVAAAASPTLAAGMRKPSLARLLPEETVLYVSADAEQFQVGVSSLGIAGLLREPEVRDFLMPLYEQAPMLDPADPIGALMAQTPISNFVTGEVALGITGISLEISAAGTQPMTLRLSPSSPINARMLHSLSMLHDVGNRESSTKVHLSIDFLAQVDAGPALEQMVTDLLRSPPPGVEVGEVRMSGVPVTAINYRNEHGPTTTIYARKDGNRWLFGGDQKSFGEALEGGPRNSLEKSEAYQNFQGRVASEGNVLFAYVDCAKTLKTFKNLVPPIAMEEARILGLDTLQGVALGVSMTEGGVRESFLLGFDGKPHGIFSLFDAFGGGFQSLEDSPASTTAFAGLRFDPLVLRDRLMTLIQDVAPGAAMKVESELAKLDAGGLNVFEDVLPALGSEVSLALSPPRSGLIPEVVFSMEIRDQQKFAKLMGHAQDMAQHQANAGIQSFALKGGNEGFYIKVPDAPVSPAFCIRNNRLIGAISPLSLKNYVYKHVEADGARTLAQSSEVYPSVLAGLTGGNTDVLTMLLYLDLQTTLPVVYDTAAPFMAEAVEQEGIPLDMGLLPMAETIEPHLSGVAIGLSTGNEGISIDIFSPTGIVPLGLTAGMMQMRHEQARAHRHAQMKAADADYK